MFLQASLCVADTNTGNWPDLIVDPGDCLLTRLVEIERNNENVY